MLITQNLEIWISSVSSDTYKQPAYALALCCSGKSHTEERTAKRRRQKPGIHVAFQELNLSPTWMGRVSLQQRRMLLLLQMAQAHCLTLSCKGKQTERYSFSYVLICFMHVLPYVSLYNPWNQLP